MLELKEISKKYFIKKNREVLALDNVSMDFKGKKFYGIMGHSGCGKSTLINIIGLIDKQTSGEYLIDTVEVSELSEDEKAELRMKKIGFVFQDFFLNPRLTALENVMVPMLINKDIPKEEREVIATNLLKELGLKDRINHKPNELSGGEGQRVAIARALANNPDIILADEPTGNLDKKNETMVFDILKKLVKEKKKCVIVVTHNNIINDYADVIYKLDNGKLVK